MNNTNTKYILALVGILGGLIVLYILSSNVVPKLLITSSKAAVETKMAVSSSYVIGGKTMAKADGTDACVVNVFLRGSDDKAVAGKTVILSGLDSITPKQVKTDIDGHAKFQITSTVEGKFEITAAVDGVPMTGKSVTVVFRN